MCPISTSVRFAATLARSRLQVKSRPGNSGQPTTLSTIPSRAYSRVKYYQRSFLLHTTTMPSSSSDGSIDDLVDSISSSSRKNTKRYCDFNCTLKIWPLVAGNMKIRKRMTQSYTEMREGRLRAFWICLAYPLQPSRPVFKLTEVVSATRNSMYLISMSHYG